MPAVGIHVGPATLRDPGVVAEAKAWAARLRRFGYRANPDRLLELAVDTSRGAEAVRNRLLAPFDPYFRYAGTWQGWQMFAAPQTVPCRMRVEVSTPQGWVVVYREGGPEDWQGELLRHERVRSLVFAMSWEAREALLQRWGSWVLGRALEEFPEAGAARLRFERFVLPGPHATAEGEVLETFGPVRRRTSTQGVP